MRITRDVMHDSGIIVLVRAQCQAELLASQNSEEHERKFFKMN